MKAPKPMPFTGLKHFEAADSEGAKPDMRLIGRAFKTQSGKQYVVGGWSFDADRQRWMIGYKSAESPVVFMRLPEQFYALVGRKPRFIPVQ